MHPSMEEVLKFNVDLGSLELIQGAGQEVSVQFSDPELKNGGVFYTDSNSLEMV